MSQKHRVSFKFDNVTTSTSAAWTTLVSIDTTATTTPMKSNSSGGLEYRVSAWTSDYTEAGIQTGIVAIDNISGALTIEHEITDRVITGGIYPATTPEIEWTESAGVLILRVKCAQKLGSAYPGYNENDRILYLGVYYRCVLTHTTSNVPPNATYWTVITDRGTYTNNNSYSTNDFVYWGGSGNWWFADAAIGSGVGNEPETNPHWIALNDRGTWSTGTGALADAPTDFSGHVYFDCWYN